MTQASAGRHTLAVYRHTARANDSLRRLTAATRRSGGRVTVVALAPEEKPLRGCCDTRSTLWNRICRDAAREDLERAALLVAAPGDVAFQVVVTRVGRAAETLAEEAVARGADEIVLLDPSASGLVRRERRRLRRTSPVPVSN